MEKVEEEEEEEEALSSRLAKAEETEGQREIR